MEVNCRLQEKQAIKLNVCDYNTLREKRKYKGRTELKRNLQSEIPNCHLRKQGLKYASLVLEWMNDDNYIL